MKRKTNNNKFEKFQIEIKYAVCKFKKIYR